jgi:hypothetical protein
MGVSGRCRRKLPETVMGEEEFFRHLHRMRRLNRALLAPLDLWEADVLRRTRESLGDAIARAVRRHLDEAFIELVVKMDGGIDN